MTAKRIDKQYKYIEYIENKQKTHFASIIQILTRLYHQKAGYTISENYTENSHRKQKGFVIIRFSLIRQQINLSPQLNRQWEKNRVAKPRTDNEKLKELSCQA